MLYLLGIFLSKIFICVLYLQLTVNKSHKRASYGVIVFTAMSGLVSILTIGIDCALNQPLTDLASHCSDMVWINQGWSTTLACALY